MIAIPVKHLCGIAGIPVHRTSASDWLARHGVPVKQAPCNGGARDEVAVSDLPPEVRRALQLRTAEAAELPAGQMDDAAHLALEAKPPGVREEAYRRAAIMGVVRRHRAAGRPWSETAASIPLETPFEAPSEATLKDWCKRVEGVDPINWAPALAPGYATDGRPKVPCDPAAWAFLERLVAASGRNGTGPNLRGMHSRAVEEAARQGWEFPRNYRTFLRHWEAMETARKRTLREGAEAAARSLTTFLPRGVQDMAAMEQVEPDFRNWPILCVWEDGTIATPWVGLVVDRASSKVVGRTVAQSESEEAVVALIANMVDTHGIPDRVLQDNGSAFNGFRMMGGQKPLVRRKDKGPRNEGWSVPGVYDFLGIKVTNHGPRMAWAKLTESLNSALRHLDNDPVFYRAQRTGPNDAPNPDPVAVPIALFRAALDRAIEATNADTQSRAKGLRKGECRNAAFVRLSTGRVGRWPTALQRRWMHMAWHLHTVTDAGQVRHEGRLWGDGTTQRVMTRYSGQKVVIGINPHDPAAPAMVYEWSSAEGREKRMIVAELPAVIEARHDDMASKQRAAAEKRRAKAEVAAHVPADLPAFVDDLRQREMAAAGLPGPVAPPKVTQLPKRGAFSPAPPLHRPDENSPEERLKRLQAVNRKIAGSGAG